MKRYLAVCLLAVLPLWGCAELASVLNPTPPGQPPAPDPVLVAQKEVDAKRAEVATLQVNLKSAEATEAPTLPQIRADLQVASTGLEAAEAKLVKAKVDKGFAYAEVTTRLISAPLQVFFPAAGPLITGIVALMGVARQAFGGGQQKPEVK